MFRWLHTMRDLRLFAKAGVPMFLNGSDELCFRQQNGISADPVVVVSVPKSGTYLFAELLDHLGVHNLDLHVDLLGFMDMRFCTTEYAVGHDVELFRHVPVDRVLPLIRPGQFIVSHFHCTPENLARLGRFKVIFTCRDLRDVFVSIMRYVAKQRISGGKPDEGWENLPTGPAKMEQFIDRYGDHYIGYIKKMRDWAIMPGVFNMTFEEVQGDFGAEQQLRSLRRLCQFLGIQLGDKELMEAVKKSLGTETVTYSGKRTSRDNIWSAKVEDFFVKNGGQELCDFWATHVTGLSRASRAA